MSAPLHIVGLTKRYAGRTILDALELQIDPGQTVMLRGPNGSGKSTLLGCIAGTIIPDQGRVTIGGHDLAAAPLEARAALRYLPQEPEVPPGLTGRELIDFFARVYDDPAGAERAAALLGFGDALDRLATTYSVGMRRQLMFAALTPGRGRLWVLDEPFAGVDADGRSKIRTTIERTLAEGAGVVIAAHDRDVPDVEPLSPRAFGIQPPQ